MAKRIAIVGGGIAGLTAAYRLYKHNDITLYEKQSRLGGNAYTHKTKEGDEVDIAVAAFGKAGYPTFFKLLDELKVERGRSLNSNVSFMDLDTKKGVYITPFSLKSLFAQNFAMFSPGHLKSYYQLTKALVEANNMLKRGELKDLSMQKAFGEKSWFKGEVKAFLMSALCLLSSMQAEEILVAPAEFFIRKLDVHNDLISPKSFYSITAIKGGTRSYVKALTKDFLPRIRMGLGVKEIERKDGKVIITDDKGAKETFDAVVLATPANVSLRLLRNPTVDEKKILGKWKYKEGRIVVHTDTTHFPERDLMQAYTFLYTDRDEKFNTSVSGALWHEPGVRSDCPFISTQHPNFPIDKAKIDLDTVFYTPIYDKDSVAVIDKLPSLNGVQNTYFCGSYFGYGLHEDAVVSAMAAVDLMEARA